MDNYTKPNEPAIHLGNKTGLTTNIILYSMRVMKEDRHNRLQGPLFGRVILARIPCKMDLAHGCEALARLQRDNAGACHCGLDP